MLERNADNLGREFRGMDFLKPWRNEADKFAEKGVGDRKGTTKKLCDKDFAERSGELSGVRSASTPLFYWVMNDRGVENSMGNKVAWKMGC